MTIDLTELGKEAGPLLVFCLGIFFITFVIRRGVESFRPSVLLWAPWKKFFVRTMPPVLGGVAASLMYKYPFLDTLPSWGSRCIYGMVAGGLSSFMYAVVKAVVKARYGVQVSESGAPDALDNIPTQPVPRSPSFTSDPAPSSDEEPKS